MCLLRCLVFYDDVGFVVFEFIMVGVIFLVLLVYLVIVFGVI